MERALAHKHVNKNQASHLKYYVQNKLYHIDTCRLVHLLACVFRMYAYLCLIHPWKETEERKNTEITTLSRPLQNIVTKLTWEPIICILTVLENYPMTGGKFREAY